MPDATVEIVGPLTQVTISVGTDANKGPFVHVEGVVLEQPTLIGADPKETPLHDLQSMAIVANALAQAFDVLYKREIERDNGLVVASGPPPFRGKAMRG